jgi:hypothetical protein
MIGRDINFHKSPEAILPGALSFSVPSYLASDGAYVEKGNGINADDEQLF